MHITIGSMRPDGKISREVEEAALKAKQVVLQTQIVEGVLSVPYTTLDDIYETSEDYDVLIEKSCKKLIVDGTLFITLGDSCYNNIALNLVSQVLETGGSIDVLPFGSTALALAMQEGIIITTSGVVTYTARGFDTVTNTDNVLVIDEIDNRTIASELKLELSKFYDDEHVVLLADTREVTSRKIMLYELDNQGDYGYFTSVVIAPVKLEEKKRYTFADLIAVMDKLRGRNGCPWDKEQTHESLKRYLVEESYEVLEAIDDEDMNSLYDELGDVLLQVVFHSKIAQQYSEFDISDVTTAICVKMISRHTHIFGNDIAHTPSDVINNWEGIKKQEKNQQTQTEVLNGVPKSMPALMRSGKVQHKAAHIGFDFRQVSEAMDKLKEEIAEVEQDIRNAKDTTEECGDLLFSAVNVVRLLKIEPETALQMATDKFIKRFAHVEELAIENNIDMKSCDLDTLDELWNSAKENEIKDS